MFAKSCWRRWKSINFHLNKFSRLVFVVESWTGTWYLLLSSKSKVELWPLDIKPTLFFTLYFTTILGILLLLLLPLLSFTLVWHIQIWFLHVQTFGKLYIVIYHSNSFDKNYLLVICKRKNHLRLKQMIKTSLIWIWKKCPIIWIEPLRLDS